MEPILKIEKTPSGFEITVSTKGNRGEVLKDLTNLLGALEQSKKALRKNIENNIKEMRNEIGKPCAECSTCKETGCPLHAQIETDTKENEFAEIAEKVMALKPDEMDQLIKDFKGLLSRR
jgi:predicted aldo/keto reductase-like oxidoreductase